LIQSFVPKAAIGVEHLELSFDADGKERQHSTRRADDELPETH
jgi:hypothetical protein